MTPVKGLHDLPKRGIGEGLSAFRALPAKKWKQAESS